MGALGSMYMVSMCQLVTSYVVKCTSHTVVHMIVIHVHREAVLNPLSGRSLFNVCGTSEKAIQLACNQHIMLLYSLTQHDDCRCSYIISLYPVVTAWINGMSNCMCIHFYDLEVLCLS